MPKTKVCEYCLSDLEAGKFSEVIGKKQKNRIH